MTNVLIPEVLDPEARPEEATALMVAITNMRTGIQAATAELDLITEQVRNLQTENTKYDEIAAVLSVKPIETITDAEIGRDIEECGRYVVELRKKEKEVDEATKPIRSAFKAGHDASCSLFRESVKLLAAKDKFQARANALQGEQLRRQREEQARLERETEAQRQRELTAISKRLKDLEGQGLSIEQEIATINELLDADPTMPDTQSQAMQARIRALEAKRDQMQTKIADQHDKAEEAAYRPSPVAAASAAPIKGKSTRIKWLAEVLDIKALCREIVEGRAPVTVIKTFDLTKLGDLRADGLLYRGVAYKEDVKATFR